MHWVQQGSWWRCLGVTNKKGTGLEKVSDRCNVAADDAVVSHVSHDNDGCPRWICD